MKTKKEKSKLYNWVHKNRSELFLAEKIRGTLFSLFIPLTLYAPTPNRETYPTFNTQEYRINTLYKQIKQSTEKNYIIRDATFVKKSNLNLVDKLRD